MKTVGIKDLKNNLSAYLREVRLGTRILVSDRNQVVAELKEPGGVYEVAGTQDPLLAEWAQQGVLLVPTRPKGKLPKSPVALPEGSAQRLLDADRGA